MAVSQNLAITILTSKKAALSRSNYVLFKVQLFDLKKRVSLAEIRSL
jgi:hypothetical protein